MSANYQKIQQEKKRGRAEETRLTSESSHPEKIRSSEPTGEVSGFEVRSDLNLKICGDGSVEGSTVDAERDESKGGRRGKGRRKGKEEFGQLELSFLWALLPVGDLQILPGSYTALPSSWYSQRQRLSTSPANLRSEKSERMNFLQSFLAAPPRSCPSSLAPSNPIPRRVGRPTHLVQRPKQSKAISLNSL